MINTRSSKQCHNLVMMNRFGNSQSVFWPHRHLEHANQAVSQVASSGLVREKKQEDMGEAFEDACDDTPGVENWDPDEECDKLQASNRRVSRQGHNWRMWTHLLVCNLLIHNLSITSQFWSNFKYPTT